MRDRGHLGNLADIASRPENKVKMLHFPRGTPSDRPPPPTVARSRLFRRAIRVAADETRLTLSVGVCGSRRPSVSTLNDGWLAERYRTPSWRVE